MSTRWSAAPYQDRPTWMMTDGSLIECPMIETTPSQRRWRVQGTTDSVSKHDLPDAIRRYMSTVAAQQGKQAWLETDNPSMDLSLHRMASGTAHHFELNFDEHPKMSFDSNTMTPIAFQFTSSEYPQLTAILWVILAVSRGSSTTVTTTVTFRPTDPTDGATHTHQRYLAYEAGVFPGIDFPLEVKRFGANPRKGAEWFAEIVRHAADIDAITLPDGRGSDDGYDSGITYTFTATNYSNDVYRDALELVQAGPALERLNHLLRQVRAELRNLGIVANLKDSFDVNKLLNGKLSELALELEPQDELDANNDKGLDPHHTITMDLANGVFTTSCSRQHLEDVAAAWEVAKFKADISGEKDVLLAYAEAFNMRSEQDRLRKVILQRRVSKPK